ncbi:O-antigen ligase family protein [Pseudofulvimonas gallinarii]|jgi:O-antigen ligase|uniref:O-antigen ligase n=1 Tax=Pseudofulvimonas gallinarii TaxID=634155 RepID=A0A4R3L2D3_9GAMM|nr:O-antigen ligase family protein [Pseudofulvimonas gallinarii]TCS93055.1 O-antigen ligase [Pseudofulvimonas gallinarii]
MSDASPMDVSSWSAARPAPMPLRQLLPPLLLWLVLALLPVGRIAELPLLAGAGWGVLLLFRDARALWRLPGVRLALGLFACYWLPSLLSAFDAVAPEKTWTQVAAHMRYAPFAVFAVATMRDAAQWQWLLRASALLLGLWIVDAWLQAFTGASLGGRMDGDRLSGIFGADNLKLGGVVATLSPLLLAFLQQRLGWRGVFIGAVVAAGVILLAGARAAWLVYALVLAGVCLRPFAGRARRALVMLAALLAAAAALGYAAYLSSPLFAARVDRTLLLVSSEADDVDHALAGRLPIWRTARDMALAHPFNGVGVRGFRHDYLQHAAADDPWREQQGALHPHQLVLEVATETGLPGLVGWLFGVALLWRGVRRVTPAARLRAWPPLLALAAMCFPLNTHYAFHSSWWGLFFWWVLVAVLVALHADRARAVPESG